MPHCIMGSVFKIRSETCRTEAQFCQNLIIKKESLQGRPKFCRSWSAVWHLFWRLWAHVTSRNSHWFSHPNGRAVVQGDCERVYAGGYLFGFRIGMLSTAPRLETLRVRGSKKGGRNYTFCPISMKNEGRNTTFSSFLLKYRGRNYTNFPETWKRGVEMAEHM